MPEEYLRDDEKYYARILHVSDGVSVTVSWPGFFWYIFDWLIEDGWSADAVIRDLWEAAGRSAASNSQHATFQDLLEREVEREGDAAAAFFEGRANSNLTS